MDHPTSRRTSWQLVLLTLAALTVLFLPTFVSAAPPTERTYRIEARSFEYTPPTIQVNQGDRLTIELTSTDVVHGLYVDGYDLNVVADPGQTAKLTFIANQSGSFRFRCSVTCGALHPFMIGKLEVGTNWLWWQAIGFAVLSVAALAVFNQQSKVNTGLTQFTEIFITNPTTLRYGDNVSRMFRMRRIKQNKNSCYSFIRVIRD